MSQELRPKGLGIIHDAQSHHGIRQPSRGHLELREGLMDADQDICEGQWLVREQVASRYTGLLQSEYGGRGDVADIRDIVRDVEDQLQLTYKGMRAGLVRVMAVQRQQQLCAGAEEEVALDSRDSTKLTVGALLTNPSPSEASPQSIPERRQISHTDAHGHTTSSQTTQRRRSPDKYTVKCLYADEYCRLPIPGPHSNPGTMLTALNLVSAELA